MAKKNIDSTSEMFSFTPDNKATMRKFIVLLSMIISGILLLVYRADYQYWTEQFTTYNVLLFGISILLLVLIIIAVLLDLKRVIKYEMLGFIVLLVGAIIISLVPARNLVGIGGLNGASTGLIAVGGVLIVIGAILSMRTGGFINACFIGILLNLLVSAYYAFGSSSSIQYNDNTILFTNFAIIFFLLSFFLLIYNDMKFFYLVKLIRDGKSFRNKKEYGKALKYCEKALKIYPYFAPAWNNKANVLTNMGKKKEAIMCYNKALAMNPDYIPAKKNLEYLKQS